MTSSVLTTGQELALALTPLMPTVCSIGASLLLIRLSLKSRVAEPVDRIPALLVILSVLLFLSNSDGSASHAVVMAMCPKLRYRARVAYDGTEFHGFQIQEGSQKRQRRTVQGELEAVLSQRLNTTIRVVGAGRTDAGVHARGQAIHFDVAGTAVTRMSNLPAVQRSIEKMLPPDICFWNLQPVPPPVLKTIHNQTMEMTFNVMYDSTYKWYSYRLNVSPTMHPLERKHRWHPDRVHQWFDLDRFARLMQSYVGTHDFRAFASGMDALERRLNTDRINTVRTVYSVEIIEENQDNNGKHGNLRIDIKLKGALYKQVRNMVGSALYVCEGGMDEATFQRLIDNEGGLLSRDDNPSKPAPPQGLTLERVYFESGDDF